MEEEKMMNVIKRDWCLDILEQSFPTIVIRTI